MRATRALLRRRIHRMRTRAALLAHLPKTNRQDNLPQLGKKIADKANRDGVAERCADPAVQKSIEGDLALIGHDDQWRRDRAWAVLQTATHHDATTRSLLRTVPGIGASLRLVLLYESHDSQRCPRGQDVVSYCRLVQCAKESAGKRSGTSGAKIGQASRKWALSEAAGVLLRAHPAGQPYLARLEHNQGQGQALTVLAPKLARAGDHMLQHETAFDIQRFLQR